MHLRAESELILITRECTIFENTLYADSSLAGPPIVARSIGGQAAALYALHPLPLSPSQRPGTPPSSPRPRRFHAVDPLFADRLPVPVRRARSSVPPSPSPWTAGVCIPPASDGCWGLACCEFSSNIERFRTRTGTTGGLIIGHRNADVLGGSRNLKALGLGAWGELVPFYARRLVRSCAIERSNTLPPPRLLSPVDGGFEHTSPECPATP